MLEAVDAVTPLAPPSDAAPVPAAAAGPGLSPLVWGGALVLAVLALLIWQMQ